MKKTATGEQSSDGLAAHWHDALALFDADLRRRGAAARTRDAYATDLRQLAAWALSHGLTPEQIDYRALRRFAAVLSNERIAATTLARKLAALRQFFRTLVEHGRMHANPAELMPAPRKPAPLPRALKSSDVAKLLDRIPATTPLELRDRA